jgi:hypothetical protein
MAMGLVLFVMPQVATGQIGYLWSFEERTTQSDLVVVAARLVTRETHNNTTIREVEPPFPLIELQTEFKIRRDRQGMPGSDMVVLRLTAGTRSGWDQEAWPMVRIPWTFGHSAATKPPKPLDGRCVAIGATTSDAVLLSVEQEQAVRAAESTQLGGHSL